MKGTIAIGTDAKKNENSNNNANNMEENTKKNAPADPDLDASTTTTKSTNADEEHITPEDNRKGVDYYRPVIVGDQERLHLDWRVSEWSRCSQTCGPDGKQVS